MPIHDADALHIALVELLGDDCVSLDPSVAEAHAGDWSDAPRLRPRMTLLPRTPEDVARALRVLAKHQQRVVVQSGLTGLAGGATPQADEVALSMARVNAIESFDRIGGTLTVQAGVPLEQLQTHVEAQGWFFPLDLGARGTCQIGGNAATNAGGNRVIRFGTMRDLILGLGVALPDGTMLSMMNRVTKNTTDIDLKQLFIGSEGRRAAEGGKHDAPGTVAHLDQTFARVIDFQATLCVPIPRDQPAVFDIEVVAQSQLAEFPQFVIPYGCRDLVVDKPIRIEVITDGESRGFLTIAEALAFSGDELRIDAEAAFEWRDPLGWYVAEAPAASPGPRMG
ncbi:FAD-binding oxidoreductase [Paraburkholderia sp. HD33-4]|uniref:FAD-binding oxidoreductase n=1 Tax=Paraburkholderia sp. HD33-4 TaxID=2883242 RepID=UPI001F430FA8|nr:FAD-binding oxidoreductase [Paraburkholderia sp. HD33-4]